MKKFISVITAAFAALTIFGAAVSANVIDGVGNAANEVIEGAGDAVNGVVEGAEDLVDGVTGENGHENGNTGKVVDKDGNYVTENEVHGETETGDETGEETGEATEPEETSAEPEESATETTNETDRNPSTGVGVVTFGALALGSLAVAATTRKKR
jgi:hypothetical protein